MSFFKAFKVILLATTVKSSTSYNTTNFCEHKCGKMHNVCCAYNPNVFGHACGLRAEELKFADREKNFLVHVHNVHRQRAASGELKFHSLNNYRAANMHVLSYSEQLAYSARCWSKQCRLSASRCRAVDGERLGEIMCFNKKEDDDTEVMPELTKEVFGPCLEKFMQGFSTEFNEETIDSFETPMGGDDVIDKQAVQSIWATARFFGCHRLKFPHTEQGYMVLLHVCHYLPRIREKMPIFVRGPPANQCEYDSAIEEPNSDYPKLCGSVRPLKEDTWQAPFSTGNMLQNIYWGANSISLILRFSGLLTNL